MASKKAPVNYVPGLNERPDDSYFPERPEEKTEDDYLIEDFRRGKKNPTMCLHEFCARNKMELDFREEEAEYRPGMLTRYGVRVIIDGLLHRQGVGPNKKEAKNDASRLAFRAVVGLDDYTPWEEKPILDDNRFVEVRTVQDLCDERGLEYSKHLTKAPDGKHVCAIVIQGLDQVTCRSSDYDEAVIKAHQDAMQLLGITPQTIPDNHGDFPAIQPQAVTADSHLQPPRPNVAHLRELLAYQTLVIRMRQLPHDIQQSEHHLAAFFMAPDQESVGELVALGTGTCSISAEHITMNGRSVLDSSCVTVARRSLRRYLAQEMLNLFANENSVFTWSQHVQGKMELAPGHSLHLFLSHPPDGDYKNNLSTPSMKSEADQALILDGHHLPTFTDEATGSLQCRSESGMFEPTLNTAPQGSLEQVMQSNEMRVMCQSDKLLLWNIVGIQGAALSHFTQPIYLDSISIGYNPNNDHGHLARAMCCRVFEDLGPDFPPGYKVHHPVLQFCLEPSLKLGQPGKSTNVSINWNMFDASTEVVIGETGKTHPASPFQVSDRMVSRICKAGMHLKWFTELSRRAGAAFLTAVSNQSPSVVKSMATEYLAVKNQFTDHCLAYEIGKWIHAPPELNLFTK